MIKYLIIGAIFIFLSGNAQSYTLEQYANAIKKAEHNSNYGI